ncbi:MAG TPA: hypothetical protein VGW36_07880 [Pyrinomonadaceae bacterium]|nr:hypothetical protein [Pyrinomonadaceae bacterium]
MSKQRAIAPILLSALLFPLVFIASTSDTKAQVEPQQGAINTTRSKNTSREAQTPIKGVWVTLAKSSGGHEATHTVQQQSGRVTSTDAAGNFSFADVAPGEYVLIFSALEPKAAPPSNARMGSAEPDPRTKPSNTLRPGNDPRNQAPTVGTGGPPGGPTGMVVVSPINIGDTIRVALSGAASGRIEEKLPVVESSGATSTEYGDRRVRTGEAQVVVKVDGSGGRILRGQVSLIK